MTRYYVRLRNGKESSGIRHPFRTLAEMEAINDGWGEGQYTIELEADDDADTGCDSGRGGTADRGGAGRGRGQIPER